MEYIIILLVEIVLFPIVYISADKWHRIEERYKKSVKSGNSEKEQTLI